MADTSEQISALLHETGETHHRVPPRGQDGPAQRRHPVMSPCALSGACQSGAGTAARRGKNASPRLPPDNR